jgi:hypothetical protein
MKLERVLTPALVMALLSSSLEGSCSMESEQPAGWRRQ